MAEWDLLESVLCAKEEGESIDGVGELLDFSKVIIQ